MSFDELLKKKRILSLPFVIFLFACASQPPANREYAFSSYLIKEDGTPKTVVVLPFENLTSENYLEVIVRKSFYNHFSSKNYRDVEISEVDSVLKAIEDTTSKSWRKLPPQRLGKIFNADFLIYGKVKGFERFFLGIYSQIALNIEVRMVESQRGKIVWSQDPDSKSHEGGIPFSLLEIIPAAIRSGYHLREEEVIDLVERTTREITAEMPDPPATKVLPVMIEIQVASFLEDSRAEKAAETFRSKGYNPRIETAMVGEKRWYRVILGPYFTSSDAEKVKEDIAGGSEYNPIFIHHYQAGIKQSP